MEIDFNPSRAARTDAGQPVPRPEKPAPRGPNPDVFSASPSLRNKLYDIPLLRSNMVDRALSLASNVKYPPDDLVDRIATLLSNRLTS
jgi:hypothetical protein